MMGDPVATSGSCYPAPECKRPRLTDCRANGFNERKTDLYKYSPQTWQSSTDISGAHSSETLNSSETSSVGNYESKDAPHPQATQLSVSSSSHVQSNGNCRSVMECSQRPSQNPQATKTDPAARAINPLRTSHNLKARQQLVFYVCHTNSCTSPRNNASEGRFIDCKVPLCAEAKAVLEHIKSCTNSKTCGVPSCNSFKWAIDHYAKCSNSACPSCEPVRKSKGAFASCASPSTALPQPIPNFKDTLKKWIMNDEPIQKPNCERPKLGISDPYRLSCISSMVNNIIPTDQNGKTSGRGEMILASEDQARKVIELTRKVEVEIFYNADSQDDYLGKLSAKTFEFKKEMEEYLHKQHPGRRSESFSSALNGTSSPSPSGASSIEQKNAILSSMLSSDTSPVVKSPLGESNGGVGSVGPPPISRAPASVEKPVSSVKSEPPASHEMTSAQTPLPTKVDSPATPSSAATTGASDTGSSGAVVPSGRPRNPKLFTTDEMRQNIWPCLQGIICLPESEPFKKPVDYIELGLLDYPEIVKKPMDISTIRRKMMDEGKYSNPWDFINDMHLMFSNAWLYNKKSTKIYKNTTRLSEIFYERIDAPMRAMGFCCGQTYSFSPVPMYCNQKFCHIPRDAKYFQWSNTNPKSGIIGEKYIYCTKCFNDCTEDSFPVCDEPGVEEAPVLNVPKSHFEEVTNNSVMYEKFVECIECGRNIHTICALHLPSIWPEFICHNCRNTIKKPLPENRYTAMRLPTNKLASFIERSVNKYLKLHHSECPHVSIRVLSSSNKVAETLPKMRARFPEFPKQFPYRHKAIFAFTQVDGKDVCIFGMTVQEYGSDCPQPNTRRVYLSYLDSVYFFEPRKARTALYHRIIMSYFEYCRDQGFEFAHIWACPPGEGDDYIFHCHPPDQKTPKPKRLQDWYKSMLDLATDEKLIVGYQDIQKACEEIPNFTFQSLPYFEGDYWQKTLDDLISQMSSDLSLTAADVSTSTNGGGMQSRNKPDGDENMGENDSALTPGAPDDSSEQNPPSVPISDKSRKYKSKKCKSKSRKPATVFDLNERLQQNLNSTKDSFFTIRLRDDAETLGRIEDPDPDVHYDLMEGRDSFLHASREKCWEFSMLRRAKYASLCMLYELHCQVPQKIHHCHKCKQVVASGSGLRCETCADLYVCSACSDKSQFSHEHELVKNTADEATDKKETQRRNQAEQINMLIKVLIHAISCRHANCRTPNCSKLKQLLSHINSCQRRSQHSSGGSAAGTGGQAAAAAGAGAVQAKDKGCNQCHYIFRLCVEHAKSCTNSPCPVPYCHDIRKRSRRQDEIMMRRRMAMMSAAANNRNSNLSECPGGGQVSYNHSSPAGGGGGGNMKPSPGYAASPNPTPSSSMYSTYSPQPSTPSENPPALALEAAQKAKLAAMQQQSSSVGSIVSSSGAGGGFTGGNSLQSISQMTHMQPQPPNRMSSGADQMAPTSMGGIMMQPGGGGNAQPMIYDAYGQPMRQFHPQFYRPHMQAMNAMNPAAAAQMRGGGGGMRHSNDTLMMLKRNPELMARMMSSRGGPRYGGGGGGPMMVPAPSPYSQSGMPMSAGDQMHFYPDQSHLSQMMASGGGGNNFGGAADNFMTNQMRQPQNGMPPGGGFFQSTGAQQQQLHSTQGGPQMQQSHPQGQFQQPGGQPPSVPNQMLMSSNMAAATGSAVQFNQQQQMPIGSPAAPPSANSAPSSNSNVTGGEEECSSDRLVQYVNSL